ncbi:TetR/AcrR family transcriptional regulator [Streptomyces sp. NPDC058045]|uniref:TetR/AcrR family transcriptional regulator n=1 Tax=Streptomyces sp. NPDC058045 TaxID=3346311 RepID=UPI0036EB6A06
MAVVGDGGAVSVQRQKRMPRAERERQMLDAAVQIFGRLGYRAASMDEIAELAGVSKPLVYLYLGSKDDLFLACIRREAANLVTALRTGVDPEDAAERQLWQGLLTFFTHTGAHPDGWALLHDRARTRGELFASEAAETRREIIGFVTELVMAAAREGHGDLELGDREVDGLALALVGATESLADWACRDATVSARDAAVTLMNVAWSGLGNLMSGHRWTPPSTG